MKLKLLIFFILMLENYFTKLEGLIKPNENLSPNLKNLKRKQNLKSEPGSPTSNNGNSDIYKGLYYEEKKTNMYLRYENSTLVEKINKTLKELEESKTDLIKLKFKNENDRDYILKLEGLIGRLKDKNYGKKKEEYEKKLREEKNKRNVDATLRQEIIEADDSEEVKSLKEEIGRLRKFKQKIIDQSKLNDELNEKFFGLLNQIRGFFNQLNKEYYNKMNDDEIKVDYAVEFNLHSKTTKVVENLYELIRDFLVQKQKENNILFEEREERIKKLEKEIQGFDSIIQQEKDKNFKLLVEQEEMKNELFILKDIKRDKLKKDLRKRKGSSFLQRTFTEVNSSKNMLEHQMIRAKKSVDRSLNKIDRVFEDNDPIKKKLMTAMKKIK